MKKLLSILGSFGMIATSSASVIACNTDAITMPKNPSNKEELLKLLEENKTINDDINNIFEALIKEGITFGKEDYDPFNDPNLQKNSQIQEYIILMFKLNAFDLKTAQYMVTLDEEKSKAFVNENSELLDNYYVPDSQVVEKDDLDKRLSEFDELVKSVNSDNFKALTSTTFKGIKNIANWAKENKFKA